MRDQNLLHIRPQLNLSLTKSTIEERQTIESFQNLTLRPILKMQHDLLLMIWKNYCEKQLKHGFLTKSPLLQSEHIAKSFKSDFKLKNRLLGVLIGHFTADELIFFMENEAELTRRMTDLMVQRLQSTLIDTASPI